MDGMFRSTDNAHIRVDATKGNAEHTEQIRGLENDKRDQITYGEDAGKETCLHSTADESVENCVRPPKTSSRTGEDDDQSNW